MLLSLPDNSAVAHLVLPFLTDSALSAAPSFNLDPLSDMQVELLDRSGLSGSASLIVDLNQAFPEGCVVWPQGRLSEVPPKSWRVGFSKGSVIPVPLDSLEGMSNADSAFVTRELARLSSMVAEGGDSAFRGLPFAVRKAYRLSLPSTSVLVGDVVRRIPEEANPRQEHLLLIAERPAGSSAGYSAAFHSRVAGTEEAVRTSEILGAVRFVKTNMPAIILSFEYEEGGRIALVERRGARAWRITWRSAYTGC